MLMFPLQFVFLRLLILEFAKVHDLADGRRCIRDNLDEVEAALPCNLDRIRRTHQSQLPTVVNDPDLGNPDIFVYADSF